MTSQLAGRPARRRPGSPTRPPGPTGASEARRTPEGQRPRDARTSGGAAAPRAPRDGLFLRPRMALGALALMLVVLGAGAGYGAAFVIPPEYAARAEILYTISQEQPTGFLRQDRNLTTQLVLLQSRTVLAPVAEDFGVSVEDLTESLDAQVVDDSEVIEVRLDDRDPERAERMLESIVDEYLTRSTVEEQSEVRDYLEDELLAVVDRLDGLRAGGTEQASLTATAGETVNTVVDQFVGGTPGIDREGLRAYLQSQLGTLVADLTAVADGETLGAEGAALAEREQWLRTRLDELQVARLAGPGAQVIVSPYVGVDPVSPRPLVTTAAGGVTALLLAALLVVAFARPMTRR